jgi:3-isopropylmalate/(R)-2-methylmalate dehydratase small subunit
MAYDKLKYTYEYSSSTFYWKCRYRSNYSCSLLKATERVGFGTTFSDWRYNNDDSPKSDFVLNNATYGGKSLLEEELWLWIFKRTWLGLFMITVSDVWSAFADIFRNNCLNVGVLPVQVALNLQIKYSKLLWQIQDGIEVNLPEQTITLKATGKKNLWYFRI